MMKRIIPIVAIISLCAGGALIYIGIVRAVQPSASPEAGIQQPAVQPTGRPTATGTPSPIPTIDYSAVYPAQTQAAAAANLAEAQERIAAAAATIVRATEQGLDNAFLLGTPTAIARETARAEETAEAQAKAQALYVEQENARIVAGIEADKRKAENAEIVRVAGIIAGLIIVCAIITSIITIVTYRAQIGLWYSAAENAAKNPLENLVDASSDTMLIPQSGDGGQSWRRIPPPPAHIDDNPQWIEAALAGESVAIDQWEKSGRYAGKYRELYDWLKRNQLLAWRDRMVLNDNGKRAVSPHSPTTNTFHKYAPNPSVPYTDDTQNAGGGGEEE